MLPKDSSKGKLRCIHLEFKLSVLIWGYEYRAEGDDVNEEIDGFATFQCQHLLLGER